MPSVWPYPYGAHANPLAIPPGFLRSYVQIHAPSSARDSVGGETVSWNKIWGGLAGVMTTSSREVYQASQFSAQVTHRVTIWYPGNIGVAGGCRVIFGARTFVVQAVENVQERNLVIHLMCLEVNGVQ